MHAVGKKTVMYVAAIGWTTTPTAWSYIGSNVGPACSQHIEHLYNVTLSQPSPHDLSRDLQEEVLQRAEVVGAESRPHACDAAP
jgi:hypothetical protein